MYASILLALATTALAAPVARDDSSATAPDHWATGYLENYQVYHSRYLALGCADKHDTTFFDDCCSPMLATESLKDDRKAYCTPSDEEASSAAAVEATASADDSDDTAASAYVSAYKPAVTQAAEKASTTVEWTAPTTTEKAAPKETKQASNSPSGDVKSGGFATYFYQGGNAGACGTVHSDWDKVIAIDSTGYWGDFATNNNSPHCGKWINIKNTNNGKTVTAMVADVCPTCTNGNSLDLSVGAFTAIASESDGMVPIEWSWA